VNESTPRAAPLDAEKPTQIFLSSTAAEYKIWLLRFHAFIRRREPGLLAALQPRAADELPADDALLFSAVLLPWLADSVILHFQISLDLSRQGAALLLALDKHFTGSAPADDSPAEALAAALRIQRRQYRSLGEYFRAMLSPIDRFPHDTSDPRTMLAGQLLALRILDELRNAHWFTSIAADFRTNLRAISAPRIGGEQKRVDFDYRAFIQRLVSVVPPGMLDGRSSDDTQDASSHARPVFASHSQRDSQRRSQQQHQRSDRQPPVTVSAATVVDHDGFEFRLQPGEFMVNSDFDGATSMRSISC
jgi:hypothetical protein